MSTPCSKQVGGEAVAQGVHGDRLVEPGGLDRLAAGALHRAAVIGREGSGPGNSQGRERVRRQWARRIASSWGESMT